MKEFLVDKGVAVLDDYNDDQLYSLSEVRLESLPSSGNTRRYFKSVRDAYFDYVDGA